MTFDPEAHPMLLKDCKQLMSPLAWTLPGRGSGGVTLMVDGAVHYGKAERDQRVSMCVCGWGWRWRHVCRGGWSERGSCYGNSRCWARCCSGNERWGWRMMTEWVAGARRGRLLGHLHSERHAAQELVPLVVVLEVGALHPALHRDLSVVVLLGQVQLDGHQGLHVVRLHRQTDRRMDKNLERDCWE